MLAVLLSVTEVMVHGATQVLRNHDVMVTNADSLCDKAIGVAGATVDAHNNARYHMGATWVMYVESKRKRRKEAKCSAFSSSSSSSSSSFNGLL
jgi:hypothetical protein